MSRKLVLTAVFDGDDYEAVADALASILLDMVGKDRVRKWSGVCESDGDHVATVSLIEVRQ